MTYEVTTATDGPTAADTVIAAVAEMPLRTPAQLPGTQGAGVGQIGPTGRIMPEFPEPPLLHSHGPARIIALCNQKGSAEVDGGRRLAHATLLVAQRDDARRTMAVQ